MALVPLFDPQTGNRVPLCQLVDTAGNPLVAAAGAPGVLAVSQESQKATYSVAGANLALAATPTDVLTLAGSASKTVRLRRLTLFGLATAAGLLDVLLIRRSAVNTGGASAAVPGQKRDINDAAATAVFSQYTANPAGLGAAVGTVETGKLNFPLAGGVSPLVFDFVANAGKPLVLRGVADILAVNLNGGALPVGVAFSYSAVWEEDNS